MTDKPLGQTNGLMAAWMRLMAVVCPVVLGAFFGWQATAISDIRAQLTAISVWQASVDANRVRQENLSESARQLRDEIRSATAANREMLNAHIQQPGHTQSVGWITDIRRTLEKQDERIRALERKDVSK